MANTTSGTVTFDKTFAVDEIIQEAYERLGISAVSGYQLKTARRSLNVLFQDVLVPYVFHVQHFYLIVLHADNDSKGLFLI